MKDRLIFGKAGDAHWPDLVFEQAAIAAYPERLNCAEVLLQGKQGPGKGLEGKTEKGREGLGTGSGELEKGLEEALQKGLERGLQKARTAFWIQRDCQDGPPDVFSTKINKEKSNFYAISYDMLEARVNQIAHVLVDELGLEPGQCVLVGGDSHYLMAASLLAIIKAGLVAVPVLSMLRAHELRHIEKKVPVRAVLCDMSMQTALDQCEILSKIPRRYFDQVHQKKDDRKDQKKDQLKDKLSLDYAAQPSVFKPYNTAATDPCLIAFTSGSSGEPKATVHFHRDVLAICDLFCATLLKPKPEDIFCGISPFAFTFGLGGRLFFPLRAGASSLLWEGKRQNSKDPIQTSMQAHTKASIQLPDPTQALLQAIQELQPTILFATPTLCRNMLRCLEEPYDLKSLHQVVCAGEALHADLRVAWKKATAIELIDGLGSTEMLHIFISSAGHAIKPGALGKLVPGYQARIMDEFYREVPDGHGGRLAVKGPTGCRYLADERQTATVKNGWTLTGDSCVRDKEGYFFYKGRVDDMIVSSGCNIAPVEIEAVLLQHPAVQECIVTGIQDAVRGHIAKAWIVLTLASVEAMNEGRSTASKEEIQKEEMRKQKLGEELKAFVKARIAPYKYPRVIEFIQELPRGKTGKVDRAQLIKQSAFNKNSGESA